MLNLANTIRATNDLLLQSTPNISFLSPVQAACLSAAPLNGIRLQPSYTTNDAQQYAATIGLNECIQRRRPSNKPVRGKTYSPLVQLSTHYDVEESNKVINDLIASQLNHFKSVVEFAYYLVGELHNNVPAHANGAGFSIAQYYSREGVLEVAVADGGCGMLNNVQKAVPTIQSHSEAIKWCLVKGNTTGGEQPFAQYLPDDALSNPYGDNVPTKGDDPNHYAGFGLERLQKFIHLASGEFAVWSGDEYLVSSENKEQIFSALHHWQGVVVVFRLPISGDKALQSYKRDSDEATQNLAERFGI